jgi:hypothetical protein
MRGDRSKEASVNRYAAITKDGALFWAKRTKMEDVDAAMIPNPNARTGGMRALLSSGTYVVPGCFIEAVSLDKL